MPKTFKVTKFPAATNWQPMKWFKQRATKEKRGYRARKAITYYLMLKSNGDVVANWFVGHCWFHGEPKDFIAFADIQTPTGGDK